MRDSRKAVASRRPFSRPMSATMERAPPARARCSGTPLAGASAVTRNSGSAPSARITAAIGATMREGSCSATFRPNSGALGMKWGTAAGSTKAQSTKISTETEIRLPSARASAEAACAWRSPAARTSMALCSTSL